MVHGQILKNNLPIWSHWHSLNGLNTYKSIAIVYSAARVANTVLKRSTVKVASVPLRWPSQHSRRKILDVGPEWQHHLVASLSSGATDQSYATNTIDKPFIFFQGFERESNQLYKTDKLKLPLWVFGRKVPIFSGGPSSTSFLIVCFRSFWYNFYTNMSYVYPTSGDGFEPMTSWTQVSSCNH